MRPWGASGGLWGVSRNIVIRPRVVETHFGRQLIEFSHHFGPHWNLKASHHVNDQHQIKKNGVQEGVLKKHGLGDGLLMPKWEAFRGKSKNSYYKCYKLQGFGVSRKGIETGT